MRERSFGNTEQQIQGHLTVHERQAEPGPLFTALQRTAGNRAVDALLRRDDAARLQPRLDCRRVVEDAIRSPGQPLPAAARTVAEDFFGLDQSALSRVRLHVGGAVDAASALLGARAFRVGDHLAFRGRHGDLMSREGQATLIHEVQHWIDKDPVRPEDPGTGLAVSDPADPDEIRAAAAADAFSHGRRPDALNVPATVRGRMGSATTSGSPAPPLTTGRPMTVQRDCMQGHRGPPLSILDRFLQGMPLSHPRRSPGFEGVAIRDPRVREEQQREQRRRQQSVNQTANVSNLPEAERTARREGAINDLANVGGILPGLGPLVTVANTARQAVNERREGGDGRHAVASSVRSFNPLQSLMDAPSSVFNLMTGRRGPQRVPTFTEAVDRAGERFAKREGMDKFDEFVKKWSA